MVRPGSTFVGEPCSRGHLLATHIRGEPLSMKQNLLVLLESISRLLPVGILYR